MSDCLYTLSYLPVLCSAFHDPQTERCQAYRYHLILQVITARQRLSRSGHAHFALLGNLQGYGLPLEGMLRPCCAKPHPIYLKTQLKVIAP